MQPVSSLCMCTPPRCPSNPDSVRSEENVRVGVTARPGIGGTSETIIVMLTNLSRRRFF